MILIVGGAYQGKLDYAAERFGISDGDIYYCDADRADIPESKKVIYEIDKWILALVKAEAGSECGEAGSAGGDAGIAASVKLFIERNPDAIVICNDISSGIVPLDATLRKWREAAGRAMAALSGSSAEVVRLFCGIPTKLK